MATRSQFRHEDIATVPRGYKVRTVKQADGTEVRIAFPPGRRKKGSGKVISILKPIKKNAREQKAKTRAQVEAMQDKAVRFLRDVSDKQDAADDIEDLSVEEYAAKKHIQITNVKSKSEKRKNPKFLGHAKPVTVGRGFFGLRKGKDYWQYDILGKTYQVRRSTKSRRHKLPLSVSVDTKTGEVVRNPGKVCRLLNPDAALTAAAGLYKDFHGKPPSKVIEMQIEEQRRGTYTALGELWELHFKAPNRQLIKLGFEGNHVKLASSPSGKQLYLIGGDQVMPEHILRQFGAEGEKDFVDLGEAVSIVYVTRKGFDGFKESAYIHKFGEEGGSRPEGFYNRLQRNIILAGGSYRIEAPGIIN